MPVKTSQSSRVTICQGTSSATDPTQALEELFNQCDIGAGRMTESPQLTQVFFADSYDHNELCQTLSKLPGPVIGCSSAGQLTLNGFQKDGISAMRLHSHHFKAVPYLIHPLDNLADQIEVIAADVHDRLQYSKQQAFGLLLVDGLSAREEAVSASLYRALGDVPIVGGSAGDKLRFQNTYVYYDGQLLQDCAVFTLCMTSLPFTVFKHQHFQSTEKRLVITEAIPERRLVQEINGEAAVKAYADCVGVEVDALNASVFSRYPLMLRIGNDYFVRGIAGVEEDGSLKFYCAIDKGLVLTIGEGTAAEEALEQCLRNVREEIGEPVIIFGCDCILRRLEMEERHIDKAIGSLMAENHVFGFSTYGEQYNSLHVNQTFTGVALGG
ncbi:FIST C-terminal domain-containing protein [Desulfobulbus rhabdoformis]|uniref:FIST N-terminal domain-containing protein n=1 Tax=Desulfobulbus rhabdoformis TaxID=34032 RepID=UPI001965F6C1|nr:FIST N-terminal domain-containing protein [Desulfobulbus rhabdoformis]MBM9614963.1 FIST C-terminal domain-containing protein [Desulfobulbus rhabdoformis]